MTDKKIVCPFNGRRCIEDGTVVDGELVACRFWVHVTGKNPQTQEDINAGDCAVAWMPLLMIENSREQRTTASEVERLRSEVVSHTTAQSGVLVQLLSVVSGQQPERLAHDNVQKLPGANNGTDHLN